MTDDVHRLDPAIERKRQAKTEIHSAIRTNLTTMVVAIGGNGMFTPAEALDVVQEALDSLKADLARAERNMTRKNHKR